MVEDGESEHLYVTPKPETTARELLEKVKNTQIERIGKKVAQGAQWV